MGRNNQQRRAAKQRQRQQQQQRRRDTRDDIGLAEVAWGLVHLVNDDPAAAREVLLRRELLPDGLAATVARLLADHRHLMSANGWTEGDVDELERRRLKVPADADGFERDVRLLALLATMRTMPPVAPRRPAAAGDEAMLAKIRALLAKAESTTFLEEAESLSAKAQELMARHRIDHVLLGDGVADSSAPVGRRIWLDDPYAEAKAHLLGAVAAANGCRTVILNGISCVHVIGFATDLDVVELLHTSLLVQATRAMAAAGPQRDHRGRSRTRSFRQSFLVAYAARIGERLRETAQHVTDDVSARESSLLPALVRRDEHVDAVLARTFPGIRYKSIAATNGAGWVAGRVAADAADLSAGPAVEG